MSLYNRKEWIEFRENVIESDGYNCVRCGRSKNEVILQVHHKIYLKGKLPWEYGTVNCETLCKGCHAAEHGIIQPKIGWEFLGQEDSGEFSSDCENSGCGATIRHKYLISHPNWGFLEVGTVCCDNLTDSQIASNKRETMNRYRSRKMRFIKSKRWKYNEGKYLIKQNLFEVEIEEIKKTNFQLTIHKLKSKVKYESLELAKESAFDTIESGTLYEYLDKHEIEYRKKK
ncbi:MAG: HNH endonuclease [Flavobacteriales bacterium]|jgi:hypothetical protein|nr:HNH endonuclease [Flavobacteriales bacterium]